MEAGPRRLPRREAATSARARRRCRLGGWGVGGGEMTMLWEAAAREVGR